MPQEFGLRVEEFTPARASRAGIEFTKGVLVTGVEPASFGEDLGFAAGDLITEINHEAVSSVTDYRTVVGKLKPGQSVVFRVLRRQDADRMLTVFLPGVVPADNQQ